ncbi:MAG: hypothetical protein RMJ56_13495 [Gemmataceae bacterium]|nr:hypothetical protein [Gemmata sp.]MDW8198607.1 hypothetical protein [Gemmataceae bacterium]
MNTLTTVVVAFNTLANALGQLLTPIAWLPDWLSLTLIAGLTGLGMLLAFKYTSNQRAIAQIRRDIRANLLTIRLFRENLRVALTAQARLIVAALRLLGHALIPMAVLTVPMIFLLAQLALWYQLAPLPVGAETVITITLAGPTETPLPVVILLDNDAIEDVSGPVRITSQRQVCWCIRAKQPGYHTLQFDLEGQRYEKQIAIGEGVMRVSPQRPSRHWSEVLLYPWETPFPRESLVQAITIEHPQRSSWIAGTDSWIVYWFLISLVAAFCLRGFLRVHI